jgi:outer membrane lipoprotein-sorting protein
MEVRDAESGQLTRTLWVDRRTFLVQKVVFFEDDRRVRTLEIERLILNQGLTANEILVLPRAASTIRG